MKLQHKFSINTQSIENTFNTKTINKFQTNYSNSELHIPQLQHSHIYTPNYVIMYYYIPVSKIKHVIFNQKSAVEYKQ